jgi:hypothetical protein
VKNIFHHPNFNVVAGIFGIVGTLLGIYFYRESIKEPNLTYYISSTRTPIVQKFNLNNLSVSYKGKPITNDLYLAVIQLWNQGNLPIGRDDILKTFTIKTPNGEEIYQVASTNSRDVVGLNWLRNTNDDSFNFDWKILEHNDGMMFQVTYGGSMNLPLILDGVIKGQSQGLTKFNHAISFFSSYRSFIIGLIFVVCLLYGWYSVNIAIFISKQLGIERGSRYYYLISLSILVIGIAILTRLPNYLLTPITPPFGF